MSTLAKRLWLRAARAGFGIIYLGGLAALISTVVAGLTPVYHATMLV